MKLYFLGILLGFQITSMHVSNASEDTPLLAQIKRPTTLSLVPQEVRYGSKYQAKADWAEETEHFDVENVGKLQQEEVTAARGLRKQLHKTTTRVEELEAQMDTLMKQVEKLELNNSGFTLVSASSREASA